MVLDSIMTKLVILGFASFVGLTLGLIASLLIDNGKWDDYTSRTRWGHRLIGVGMAIPITFIFFSVTDDISERAIWSLLSTVAVFSLAGMQGYKIFIRRQLGSNQNDTS